MVSVYDVEQKTFKVKQTHKFKFYGQGLDVVTTANQVSLSTTYLFPDGKTRAKWGNVQKLLDPPQSCHIKVQVELTTEAVHTKPAGWVLRFFAWLWAVIRRWLRRGDFGDLTITITDQQGTVLMPAKKFDKITYQP